MNRHILSEILVFKTNIASNEDVERIKSTLCDEKNISKWNIDLEDIDKVLRIECDQLHPSRVIQRVRQAGFICEELQ